MSEQNCPNCKNSVPELVNLDEAYRQTLSTQLGLTAPNAVCSNCVQSFEKALKSHTDKETQRVNREASRLNLWRRRVDIIRDARDRFASKDFPGAVSSYEKYLRIIEMIYDVKPNQLKVAFFSNPARARELVLITSAYWDLVRIYDQSEKFNTRFHQCAEKLSEFLPLSPMYRELLKGIKDYKKNAKHRDVFQDIAKKVQKGKKRCFIATAAFETGEHPTVDVLCLFRDEVLANFTSGRIFIRTYYTMSPPIARILDHSAILRYFTRSGLTRVAGYLKVKFNLKRPGH